MAFVWPRSREWMIQLDPDSCFAVLSSDATLERLVLDEPSIEALPGDPSTPCGSAA